MISATTVGCMNYNVLRNILAQGKVLQLERGAEIGVLYGNTSAYLLTEFPALTLFSIDPYLPYFDGDRMRTQEELDHYEAQALQKLTPFGARSQRIKQASSEAAKLISDLSLDFVFIDANHEYAPVRQDLALWFPKVRIGGIVAGHDFLSFPGVKQAVSEFSSESGIPGFHTPIESDVWFMVKP